MKPYVLIGLLAIGLTGCKAATFDERLAGKTGKDREQKAYYACIERANYPIPGGHEADYVGHEGRMWAICDAMHETNTNGEK